MTAADVLRQALALLTPDTWVNHAPATLAQHCAITATDTVTTLGGLNPRIAARVALGKAAGGDSIAHYNDSLTDYAELQNWFNRAIAIAEQEAP